MRRLFFLILAFLLLAGPALGYDVLIVQSTNNPAYDEALRGFRGYFNTSSRLVVMSDYADVDIVRIVREERPRLVVALGDEALAATRNLRQTPVLALMTIGIRQGKAVRPNVTGIDMYVPPERYLPLFNKLKAKNVGIIYNPEKTGWYVKKIKAAAQKAGLNLMIREVRNPRETIGKLAELKGKVDALWMVPDISAIVRENLEAWFNFSLEQKVPVVSFTGAHLRYGAATVIDIDRVALGRQAGEIAAKLLNGTEPSDLPVTYPRACSVKANGAVLDNLGYPVQVLERLLAIKE